MNTNFEDNLKVTLLIQIEGEEVKILSGNIEKLSLIAHSYGYDCGIQFTGFEDDKLSALFSSPKITKATLSFFDHEKEGPPLLEIKGIVTDKYLRRVDSDERKKGMYEIFFSDNAKVTWKEHFPTNIYVDKTMKDVFDEHKNDEITIKYDWDVLEETHPIIAFALEYKGWTPEKDQVSFYSFLTWYLNQEGGVWEYDYKKHAYSMLGKKSEGEGEPYGIYEWCVNPPICKFPQAVRYNDKILKHSSDTLNEQDNENPEAFKSVRVDAFDSGNYRFFPELVRRTIKSKQKPEKNSIEFTTTQMTEDLTIDKIIPGSMVTFKADKTTNGTWSKDAAFKDKVFRVRSLVFEAEKMSTSEKEEKPVAAFQILMKGLLEYKEELFIERPDFIPLQFPFTIQGKIFSTIGEKEQTTYNIAEGENAPLGQYLVSVPLAGKDKKVVVPFTPDFMTGQYYFPFCKDERVLLSMYFHTAKIERVIDWQPLARLPSGVQGNQIVLSSNGKDKYVILKHEFVDGKDSVFTIKQSSSEEQTQTITITEKDMIVVLDEKDKKTLLINLNHEKGLTLSLKDKNADMTQETIFDGKAMTHLCKGSAGTSTIVQKPDSITVECDKFSVKSKEIILDAEDSISQSGKSKVNIETAIANIKAPSVKLG